MLEDDADSFEVNLASTESSASLGENISATVDVDEQAQRSCSVKPQCNLTGLKAIIILLQWPENH